MLKEIKEKIYNKRTSKELRDVEFENFTFHGRLPYPIFFAKLKDETLQRPFVPETEKMFKLSIEKIKSEYFKKISMEDFKYRVQKYCEFFHFDEATIDACLKIYNDKIDLFLPKGNEINQ